MNLCKVIIFEVKSLPGIDLVGFFSAPSMGDNFPLLPLIPQT